MKCTHHQIESTYFCETCKELVCSKCLSDGPHQSKNHKVSSLQDAYTVRQTYIRDRIEGALKAKKETLMDHLQLIDDRLHEIVSVQEVIQKDAHMEFEGGIIKRLNDAGGSLVGVLQKEIAQLQTNLNEVDDYIHTFEYLALTEQNVLPLLFMSKQLSKQLMRLGAIIIKTTITQHPSDLPRELLELRTRIQNGETLTKQVEFKKSVMWKCRADKLMTLQKIKEEFFIKMENEITEWVHLLKRIIISFDALCLICTFCGCFMSQDIVNEECKFNAKQYEDIHLEFKGFCVEMPKVKQFGNSQHFYGNPKPEYLILRKEKYPNFGNHFEQKRSAKEVYMKLFRSLWFSILDLKARRYLKQMNIQALFKQYDPQATGWLTLVKFKYLLSKELHVPSDEIHRLVAYFKDNDTDRINYQYFLEVDWYIEELMRLEQQLKDEEGKHPKLYGKRPKAVVKHIEAAPIRPKPGVQPQIPVYSSFTRFSQPLIEDPLPMPQPRFGFVDRPQQNRMATHQEKSSSVGSRRVHFMEDSNITQSRFQESLPAQNQYQKLYQ